MPDAFLQKTAISPDGPLSRASRRQSLSEIGFGRMETYTKLDKLGEVSVAGGEWLWGRGREWEGRGDGRGGGGVVQYLGVSPGGEGWDVGGEG